MLIDALVAQQMRADGEQRGVIEVGLAILPDRDGTMRMLRTDVLYG